MQAGDGTSGENRTAPAQVSQRRPGRQVSRQSRRLS